MRRRTCRTSRRTYRVLARVVGAGVLMGMATACVADRAGPPRGFPEAAVDEATVPASPTAPPAAALTDARARSALLRAADLGGAWSGTGGAATWRDGLLKGRTDPPECQELLDAVYAEDLLGEPKGGRAVTGFDDEEYGSQLRYQVGAYDQAHVDERLDHFRQLAERCREFTITGFEGREYAAEVTPVDLPGGIGDARQGLRLVVSGDVDGEDGALTLELATVRVGDTAALLTHGGLYGIDDTATREAARAGAQRLQEVLDEKKKGKKGKREKGGGERGREDGEQEERGRENRDQEERGQEERGQEEPGERGASPDASRDEAPDRSADEDPDEPRDREETDETPGGYRDEALVTSPSASA